MRHWTSWLLLVLVWLAFGAGEANLIAQNPERELIVRWHPKASAKDRVAADVLARRPLSARRSIELLTFADAAARERAEAMLSSSHAVLALEPNRAVDLRSTPNDPEYAGKQGNLARAGFDRAWNLSSGGQTTDQHDIVVAILDAGFDVRHEDLAPSLWRNPGEIPNDGQDNDNNGYVDDSYGWDLIANDNAVPLNTHGTQVMGILGAKGNNGKGIAGTNWDLKVMLFSIDDSAGIIEAYEYILEQRRRWNASQGAEGAFVVATNLSLGIEGATCADYAVWGGLYDDLGNAGVLTAAATANRSWDVDDFGDMPTDCPSDYLIGVANLGADDLLYRSSAFGRRSIDLAAHGEESFTTRNNGSYGPFGSTSAAAPYVAGAIALLYATPCPLLLEQSKTNPGAAALLVREAILGGTDPNQSLNFRTATGGSLNVFEAQRRLVEACGSQGNDDFAIARIFPNPTDRLLTIETNALVFGESGTVVLYDALGRSVRQLQPTRLPGSPVRLQADLGGLPAGAYALQLTERGRTAWVRVVLR
ncbi:S8 family peptidase [Neolewinella lacunae]|uniref:S8 family peptidase n=1 Tax=Neolewinella lacunae TaxID=1517758 RepID=A0A923PJ95_9BACT|nr:S8 family peptidase [Neolewinella lacunae]MBC6994334.1 S8 family peptidase [Neolewinella lacunae]MDN3635819.1 S8 family peptidase [Neolewinella lacunae]